MSDTTPSAEIVTSHPDADLIATLSRLGDVLAIRTLSESERAWVEAALDLSIGHPDPFIRASMAQRCSLRQLRRMLHDSHIAVRAACASNPFVIDIDVQLALAGDAESVVVHALLDQVDPYRPVCDVIISGPHVAARARLAERNLAGDLLERLAGDPNPDVAAAAADTLAHRQRVATRRGRR